jgi:hypothetical protein
MEPLGKAHSNLILNIRKYVVKLMDGQKAELAANIIVQNMFAQCHSKGNQYLLLFGIVDHREDDSAIEKKDL